MLFKLKKIMNFRPFPIRYWKIGISKTKLIENLKDQSREYLRLGWNWNSLRSISWNYEYIAAQRLRRGQQFFIFYTQMLGRNTLIKFLRAYQKEVQKKLNKCLVSAVGIYLFDWNSARIKYESIKEFENDIEFALNLQNRCSICSKSFKNTSNLKLTPIEFCQCPYPDKKFQKYKNEGWLPYIKQDDMVIWRKQEHSSLYSYKAYAKYKDISPNDFFHVQTDLVYRKQWDDSAITLEVVETDPVVKNKSDVVYWEMRWPRLFANRDYVYCRRCFVDTDKNLIIICNKSINHPKCPVDQNKHRVEEYWSYMVIKPLTTFNEPGLEYTLTYFDNPGLALPSTITSWVAQKQMPEFLKKLYSATKQYANQKKTQSVKMIANWESFKKSEADSQSQNRLTSKSQNKIDSGLVM